MRRSSAHHPELFPSLAVALADCDFTKKIGRSMRTPRSRLSPITAKPRSNWAKLAPSPKRADAANSCGQPELPQAQRQRMSHLEKRWSALDALMVDIELGVKQPVGCEG